MADDLKPMTDADIETPSAIEPSRSAEPLKNVGSPLGRERSAVVGGEGSAPDGAGEGKPADVGQTVRDQAGKLGHQATERLRLVADDGKARATGALDQLSRTLTEAATQVDEKLGAQYGQYARSAASQVQTFSDGIRDKNVDQLLDDARSFVRASPAVAIGVAAALGFAAARLLQAGVDDARA